MQFPEYKIEKNTQRKRTKMAAKLKKRIAVLGSAKNDLETVTKDAENKNSIKPWGILKYIIKFPDPNAHENHHFGEPAMISEPRHERLVKEVVVNKHQSYKGKHLYLSTFGQEKKTIILQKENQAKQQKK